MNVRSKRALRLAAVLLATAAALPAGAVTAPTMEFVVPTASSQPFQIVTGPGGALWFTELAGNKIGRVTAAGVITEFPVPTGGGQPTGIVAGPDGAFWFTEAGAGKIGRITTAGVVTEFPIPTASSQPFGITVGVDGALWFAEQGASKIGRITTAGVITEYATTTGNSAPKSITAGLDGALWFTESNANKIGRITTAGLISEFSNPNPAAQVAFITRGPNGNLVFTENQIDAIATIGLDGRFQSEVSFPTVTGGAGFIGIGPDAAVWLIEHNANKIARYGTGHNGPVLTEYDIPTGSSNVATVTAGPDGNLWFTEQATNKIGKLTPNASPTPLLAAVLPSSRSVTVGTTATAFATIINNGTAALTNCGITPLSDVPPGFVFQSTNPSTNAVTGTPNATVPLAAGASQSFYFGVATGAPFTPANVVFSFTCGGVDPVVPIAGLNTLLLSASATPVPDIISIAATPTNNGTLSINGTTGSAAFAVATTNVGASATAITATPVIAGGVTLPLSLTVCQTIPSTGACMSTPTPTVTMPITGGGTPTFGIFATASGAISNLPAVNRIAVQFTDASGAVRGSTSVAVQTQTSVAMQMP
ncbi:MAG: lyase-like protein [Rhodospirillales bacterium]|nr:lyase-like protein [Rhodospirillales bacterium]